MARGGFVTDGCPIHWEPYPYPHNKARFADGEERGVLVCVEHDCLVDFGVTRGVASPDVCQKANQDETR